MFYALLICALIATIVVNLRALYVIGRLHWRTHHRSYLHFLGFGTAYIMLAAGAWMKMIDFIDGTIQLGGLVLLFASFGLIVFDKRVPRTEQKDGTAK